MIGQNQNNALAAAAAAPKQVQTQATQVMQPAPPVQDQSQTAEQQQMRSRSLEMAAQPVQPLPRDPNMDGFVRRFSGQNANLGRSMGRKPMRPANWSRFNDRFGGR